MRYLSFLRQKNRQPQPKTHTHTRNMADQPLSPPPTPPSPPAALDDAALRRLQELLKQTFPKLEALAPKSAEGDEDAEYLPHLFGDDIPPEAIEAFMESKELPYLRGLFRPISDSPATVRVVTAPDEIDREKEKEIAPPPLIAAAAPPPLPPAPRLRFKNDPSGERRMKRGQYALVQSMRELSVGGRMSRRSAFKRVSANGLSVKVPTY